MSYEIRSNDVAQNLESHLLQIPLDVLNFLEQNPNTTTITFLPQNQGGQAQLKILDKVWKVKVYPEKNSFADVYRLSDTCFEQVGVVQIKLMVETTGIGDEFARKIREETALKNQKHRSIGVLGSKQQQQKTSRKTMASNAVSSTSSVPVMKPMTIPHVTKPSYDKDVLEKVRQKGLENGANATTVQKRPTKRKNNPVSASSTNKKQRTSNASDNDDNDSESSVNGMGNEVSESDEDDENVFHDMMSKQSSEPPKPVKQHHKFYDRPVQTLFAEYEDLYKVDLSQSKPVYKSSHEISTLENFETLQKEYADKYNTYKCIHEKLVANTKLFNDMYQHHGELEDEQEKSHLFEKMRQMFKLRYKEVQQLTRKYCCLHEELKEIKEMINNFVKENRVKR